ncbi:hypothetical protein [Oryzihumus sp.]|jgi:hypothetical protein|uniref:hypothetical protein n=1 Tax=Oryzihumus sp. TaxID=1968903 RepID=UPI002EDBA712
MSSQTPQTDVRPHVQTTTQEATATGAAASLPLRLAGAALSLGVGWIHVTDQGGFPGSKTPTYVGIGYYVLELVAVLVAATLLFAPARRRVTGWFLATGVALGPLVGYVLSRGPGLPAYTDDRGNWTEPLGLISLAVEGLLLLLSLAVLRSARRTA